MRVEGSVALVTGGASGLGEAVVRMLAAGGCRVAIVDLPGVRGAALADELGDGVTWLSGDVTDRGQVAAAADDVVRLHGRLDVCVNCAGIAPVQNMLDDDGDRVLDVFERAVAVNLVGLFDVVRATARHMIANAPGDSGERGLVVNVASIAGYEGQAGQAAYAATKGAVIALTIQLARELAAHGIRVMGIAPGMMDTPLLAGAADAHRAKLVRAQVFPRRLGRPEELAALVRAFIETTFLNGEVVRLDAAARLGHWPARE